MSTPEAKVKKAVIYVLNAYNAYHFYPMTHGMGRSGIPDIVACCNGKFVGIECKAGDNQTTELQRRELRNIQEAGGYSLVIRENNIDELETLLQYLSKGIKHEPTKPTSKSKRRHLRLCDAPVKD